VARALICPACQHQGSIPDEARPKRVRCPNCRQTFEVKGSERAGAGSPGPAEPAQRPEAAVTAALDDANRAQPLSSPPNKSIRRTPGAADLANPRRSTFWRVSADWSPCS
jgi:hypothetical protein